MNQKLAYGPSSDKYQNTNFGAVILNHVYLPLALS